MSPNPNSPAQIKDWLFSIGWKPENFNEGVNGKIPTYYLADKSLCPSVLKLGEVVKSLDDLGVLKHRIGLFKGLPKRSGRWVYLLWYSWVSLYSSYSPF